MGSGDADATKFSNLSVRNIALASPDPYAPMPLCLRINNKVCVLVDA